MKIIDAYILARTKRKTRRIRTALVIIVSALLFAVLFFVVFIVAGITHSAAQVKDVGFNNRYLTSILSVGRPNWDYEALSNKIYADMDAELRAKKIKVDQNTHNDVSYAVEYGRRINIQVAAKLKEDADSFERSAGALGKPIAIYHLQTLGLQQAFTYQADYTKDIKVEALQKQQQTKAEVADDTPLGHMEFYGVEQDMMRTQLAPGQTFDWQPGQPVPLILPYPYLERLAGKSYTNLDATAQNKGYKELIAAYTGKLIDYCYRNQTAQQQLQSVITYNYSATTDNDTKTKPIEVPICAGFDQKLLKKVGIIQDSDDTGVKPLFEAPPPLAPQTQRIQFKIVGFMPGQSEFANNDIITSIFLGVNSLPGAQSAAIVPTEVVRNNPIFSTQAGEALQRQQFLMFDFANRADQKQFLSHSCRGNDCVDGSKPYMGTFGNLSVVLEGIFDFLSMALFVAVTVMMAIATLMIMLTISKVIADSSKEIGVFRALGARRRDIAQIYFAYGGMLTASAMVVAVAIGAAAAYGLNMLYGDRFAATLIQAVGAYSQNIHVSLLGFEPIWTIGVAAALSLAAIVGISIPVLATLKRKLINILREE